MKYLLRIQWEDLAAEGLYIFPLNRILFPDLRIPTMENRLLEAVYTRCDALVEIFDDLFATEAQAYALLFRKLLLHLACGYLRTVIAL